MNFSSLLKYPISRLKVRGLVKYKGEYYFLKRSYYGSKKSFLICPGGRVQTADRQLTNGKKDIEKTLRFAMEREIFEDLGATGIEVRECIGISRDHDHFKEVLFVVHVDSINWKERTGPEFNNPNRGSYELITFNYFDKATLGRNGYCFLPKEWRKIICSYAREHRH